MSSIRRSTMTRWSLHRFSRRDDLASFRLLSICLSTSTSAAGAPLALKARRVRGRSPFGPRMILRRRGVGVKSHGAREASGSVSSGRTMCSAPRHPDGARRIVGRIVMQGISTGNSRRFRCAATSVLPRHSVRFGVRLDGQSVDRGWRAARALSPLVSRARVLFFWRPT